jgi:hypothetical protein
MESHIREQDAALDRMSASLSRLSTLAGTLETELELQLQESEELDRANAEHAREAAALQHRNQTLEGGQHRIDLLCCAVCMAMAGVLVLFFYFKRSQGAIFARQATEAPER